MKNTVKILHAFIIPVFLLAIPASVFADNIRVGLILPLTGNLSRFGEIEKMSFQMAADEIDGKGGIKGKKIELIIEDTSGDPQKGYAAMEKLILQDKVHIISGGCSSSVVWTAAAAAQKNKIPFLVNTASADKITERGWDYVFRLNPPVSEYYNAPASFFIEVADVKTFALLYENSNFGKSGAKVFVRQCKRLGMKMVMKVGYDAKDTDFTYLLGKIKAGTPDLVYIISGEMETAALLVHQSKELKVAKRLYAGGSLGFTGMEFQRYAGDDAEYIFSNTLWTPSVSYPGAGDYYNRFISRYHMPPDYHGAQAYAAMKVMEDALKRASSLTPEDLLDSLSKTDIMTPYGPVKFISYGKKTRQNRLPTFLGQWIEGRFEAVWPRELVKTKYVYPVPDINDRDTFKALSPY